jgi:hypothetical protein
VQFEKNDNKKPSLIKSIIEESKKLRAERGEDFFSEKRKESIPFDPSLAEKKITAQIHSPAESEISKENYKSLRESHLKLTSLISDNEKKIFDENNQVLQTKKARSKCIHLYVDEKIEHFLKAESEKSETKWGLRKNAGLGNLIQKFIMNFIELKKREERQLVRVKKVITEFQVHLVEFKKFSAMPGEFLKAEEANKKMRTLSNDLNILLSLLEFEEGALKNIITNDEFKWIEFILKWKKILG